MNKYTFALNVSISVSFTASLIIIFFKSINVYRTVDSLCEEQKTSKDENTTGSAVYQ